MCPDYPVTSYTVVVEDSSGVEVARITDNHTQISIGNLTADLSYTYYIIPMNQFGDGMASTPLTFGEHVYP